MSEPPVYALPDEDLLAACRIERSASGGPGGQHANRNATAIRLTHPASGQSASCSESREQAVNRSRALKRLRLRLALWQRGAADERWLRERMRGTRLPVAAAASAYHLVVAALFDQLERDRGSLAACARHFGSSSSQMTRVLQADKEVRQAADALRARFDLGPLR